MLWFKRKKRHERKGLAWNDSFLTVGQGLGGALTAKADEAANTNSAVEAVVRWAVRSVVEPRLSVYETGADGMVTEVVGHPLGYLANNPAAYQGAESKLSGRQLLQAKTASLMLYGEAFEHVLRDKAGTPVGLEFLSPHDVEVVPFDGNPRKLLGYKVIVQRGMPVPVPPSDMVHTMVGIDPTNPLRGWSPLRTLTREVLTDREANVFTHAVLRNLAVIGLLVSPKDADVDVSPEAADHLAAKLSDGFGGANRGKTYVSNVPLDINKVAFSPEELALDKMRRVPEERISAVFGIPAVVAGLGAGLDRSTFANFKEAREAATEQFLCPLWAAMADAYQAQLLPLYGFGREQSVAFDLSGVRVLQEDQNALWTRAGQAFTTGVAKRADARAMVGLEVDDAVDDVYIQDLTLGAIAPGGPAQAKALLALRQASAKRSLEARRANEAVQAALLEREAGDVQE